MITEEQLQELERCDEYSLRHYQTEISDLVEAYRQIMSVFPRLLEYSELCEELIQSERGKGGDISELYVLGSVPEPLAAARATFDQLRSS